MTCVELHAPISVLLPVRDIAEIMIGHTVGNMQQVYDHYNYLPQQTAAYKQWLKKLAELKQVAL